MMRAGSRSCRCRIVLGLLALPLLPLLSMPAVAQGRAQGGMPVMDRPNIGASGPLAIMQLLTEDADALIAAWPKPSSGAQMNGQATARFGHKITTFLVFKGCKPDPAGKCDVVADFEVINPRGAVTTARTAVPVWVGPKPPSPVGLQLSRTGFGMTLDDSNAVGLYRIRVVTTDRIAKLVVPTEQIVMVRTK